MNNGKGLNYGLEPVRKSTTTVSNNVYYGILIVTTTTIYNLTAGKDFKVGKDKKNILGINFNVCGWAGVE